MQNTSSLQPFFHNKNARPRNPTPRERAPEPNTLVIERNSWFTAMKAIGKLRTQVARNLLADWKCETPLVLAPDIFGKHVIQCTRQEGFLQAFVFFDSCRRGRMTSTRFAVNRGHPKFKPVAFSTNSVSLHVVRTRPFAVHWCRSSLKL